MRRAEIHEIAHPDMTLGLTIPRRWRKRVPK